MAKMSNYLENAIMNHILRNVAYTPASTLYLSLYTTSPEDNDVGTEVSGGDYARQVITFNAPSNGVCTNSSDVTFPTASAIWGTVTHVGIRDALTSGNLLYHGNLSISKVVSAGDQFKVLSGNLSISID